MSDYDSIKKTLLKELKKYGLKPTDKKTLEIYKQYLKNCSYFQKYVIGNLDTFKKAACVMSAILKCKVVGELEKNDEIALDISLSLIERPSYYFGDNYDKEVPLDMISINKLKENTYLWKRFSSDTLQSIQLNRKRKVNNSLEYCNLEEINIMSMADNFELLYQIALFKEKPLEYYGMPMKLEKIQKKLSDKKTMVKK